MTSSYRELLKNKLQKLSPLILTSHIDVSLDEDTRILFISGKIVFIDESILDFTEKFSTLGHRYRFHYMDKAKHLIIRWDNIPHHKHLDNFPHHQHTFGKTSPSLEINLITALEKIEGLIKII